MSNSFNPNASAFIPSKQQQIPAIPLSQAKQQKSNPNMSSQAAPPSLNPKVKPNGSGLGSKRTGKQREPKLIREQQKKNQPDFEDFALDLEDDSISGHFKGKGRRGQISINHLLDFSLPSRDLDSDMLGKSYQPVRRRRRSSNHHDRIHLQGPEFVNANYRFVVDYRPDYNGQVLDPNLVLEDSTILRVIVPKGHNCPICLTEDIIAPRMSSCGHIFCHTCLLSFLDSEPVKKKDAPVKKYKECPLCSLSVRPNEIKPVLINEVDERFEAPQVGHDVVMKLMAKPFNDILPIPHSLNLNHKKIGNIPWYSDSELYPYSRIMKAGLKFIVNCYETDKLDILKQYEEDKLLYNDDDIYVNKAIDEINMRLEILKTSFDNRYEEPNPLVNSMNNLSINKNDSGLYDGNCFFFYQTSFTSTVRYFLSPLDIKVLLRTFGSYSNFPPTLLLKVDNVSYGHMVTEATLKRHKYFGHLPLGTELAFIEVNWKHMLSPEIFKEFSKELNERRRKILTKLKKEDHAKKTYETQQELKNLEFYKSENNGWGTYDFGSSQEVFETPALNSMVGEDTSGELESSGSTASPNPNIDEKQFATTVWGTKILKSQQVVGPEDYENDWDTEDLIRKAKEEERASNGIKKKGRKKKLLVLASSSGRGF